MIACQRRNTTSLTHVAGHVKVAWLVTLHKEDNRPVADIGSMSRHSASPRLPAARVGIERGTCERSRPGMSASSASFSRPGSLAQHSASR